MKPKIGDKFIIEIDSHMTNKNGDLYGIKGFRSLVFDQNGLDKLTPYIMDEAYAEGYTLAESKYRGIHDDDYQRGLDDAWDAARKIGCTVKEGGLANHELVSIFGNLATSFILRDYEAIEVIEKIREYEESKAQEDAICNGDEVYFTLFSQNFKAIAIQRDLEGSWQVLNDRGRITPLAEELLTKTGRHVDLTKLFGGEDA